MEITSRPTDDQTHKSDPIRDRYYRPLEIAENVSDWLFWITAIFSISALTIDKSRQPDLYDFVQILFIIFTFLTFIISHSIRFYFIPRSEIKRRQDLLSNSFNISITHERTIGYYNNDQLEPIKRLGSSILENSFFSKNIILKMSYRCRTTTLIYIIVWMYAFLNRKTDLTAPPP